MQAIRIDDTPANIALMMEDGMFHSHQDGRWRYSPYGGETVYVNDPTAKFDARSDFPNGRSAAAHKSPAMIARAHPDQTRGLYNFDRELELKMSLLYGPRDAGETQQREWVLNFFKEDKS